MRIVCVVVRKLSEKSLSVVTAVIEEPKYKVDDLEHYFKSRFNDIKNDFCNKLVEFRSAEWTYSILKTQM